MDATESIPTAVTCRRFLLSTGLAYSFGGFSFYATVVVPVGTEVLDAASQGFVTQTVTHFLNAASGVTVALLLWELINGRRRRSLPASRYLAILTAGLSLCWLTLILLHSRLDSLLDVDSFTVAEPDRFYRLHQAYLWISTVQWLLSLVVIWRLIVDWQRVAESDDLTMSTSGP
ncbi:MAG: hypothetical protein VB858_14720 [Planctomycetaceae bacterium]